ncbi:hypothetical protein A9Z05_24220 [Burkholderia sp. A2]|nr:hypothetical protein A9Z05_24220 [Burkholderia sp. A2]
MPRVDGRGGALTSRAPHAAMIATKRALRVIRMDENAACGRRADSCGGASFRLLASVFMHDGAPCVVARRRFGASC